MDQAGKEKPSAPNARAEEELVKARAEIEKLRQNFFACSAILRVPRLTELYHMVEKHRLAEHRIIDDE